ncbi:MAG: FKBP-type peptidyl-prolyl cis-trans isomerase [Thiohalobacterales bacterium]
MNTDIKHPIGINSTVTLHLSLTLEDGTVAEETFSGKPHRFRMGDGSLLHGLELGLYGLKSGDTRHLVLDPEQAWGLRDPEKIQRLPRERFSVDMQLAPGLIIGFDGPDGAEVPGAVLSVSADSVEVDFNHPLAGHAIAFDVEIIDVVPAEQDDE